MFFDVLTELCQKRGISTYRACIDIGLNRSAVAKWKEGAIPRGETLEKLARYFGVSTDYLLGKESSQERQTQDNMDSSFFRLLQTAQAEGYSAEDLKMAMEFIKKARERDKNNGGLSD